MDLTLTAPRRQVQPASKTLDYIAAMMTCYARTPSVRTVAVVGNAPLTPDDARADAIDACDLVIRVNSFILDTQDLPRQQGRHVNVVVFNRLLRATPFSFAGYRERLYLMVEQGRLFRETDLRPAWWPEDLGIVNVPNREVTLPLSEELGLDSRNRREWATTGLTSVWLAMRLFPEAEILITGYSMIDHPEQTEWEHAWGDQCAVGREHHIDREGTLMRSWINDGLVRFLR